MKHHGCWQVRLYGSHCSLGLPLLLSSSSSFSFSVGRQSLYGSPDPQATAGVLEKVVSVTDSPGSSSILLLVSEGIRNSSSRFRSLIRQPPRSTWQLLLLMLPFFLLDVAPHAFGWNIRIVRIIIDAGERPLLAWIPIFSSSRISLLQTETVA